MKTALVIFCILGFTVSGHSQYTITRDGRLVNADGQSVVTRLTKDTLPVPKRLPYNGMPNAIRYAPLPPVYQGNNGRGFDIYASRMDNMPILMPDTSNRSSMPNAFRPLVPGNMPATQRIPKGSLIPAAREPKTPNP